MIYEEGILFAHFLNILRYLQIDSKLKMIAKELLFIFLKIKVINNVQ